MHASILCSGAVCCFISTFLLVRLVFVLTEIAFSRRRAFTPAVNTHSSATSAQQASGTKSHAESSSILGSSSETVASLRTLVILGSGGHTAEMMSVMDGIDRRVFTPIIYVRANTDVSSEERVKRYEESKGNLSSCKFIAIPRSREVGQSYFTSIFTTLVALKAAFSIVFHANPQIVLCNGPGTGLPLCVAAFFYRVLLFRDCRVVFIESFCRVESLSMSGLLLHPIVDEFVVQWPELDKKQDVEPKRFGWRGVKYIGRLC